MFRTTDACFQQFVSYCKTQMRLNKKLLESKKVVRDVRSNRLSRRKLIGRREMLEIKELDKNERILVRQELSQVIGGMESGEGGTTLIKDGVSRPDQDVPGGTEYAYAPNDHYETTYVLWIIPYDSITVPNN